MSFIDHKIPQSALEKIRDAIFTVLSNEFANQIYEFGNTDLIGCKFFAERTVPISKEEISVISISTFKGDYGNQSIGSTHGQYVFVLDFMANASSKPNAPGYQLAAYRLQKLMMAARYVLMHPNYITLGLTGIIEHTEVSKFQIAKDERVGDASSEAIGQILFMVNCEEGATSNEGILLQESATYVTIELTAQGYMYGAVYTPPLDPRYVYIRDKATGNVIGMIEGGNYYDQTTIKNIIDSFPNNQVNIVNNILP